MMNDQRKNAIILQWYTASLRSHHADMRQLTLKYRFAISAISEDGVFPNIRFVVDVFGDKKRCRIRSLLRCTRNDEWLCCCESTVREDGIYTNC